MILLVSPLGLANGKTWRELALTFDDCPRSTSRLMTGMARAEKLISEFKRAGIPQVAFFCNSPSRAEDGVERINYFAQHGHLIANHSAEHPDLNETPVSEFTRQIDQADAELNAFPNFRKWFRFPYLREGKTPEVITQVRDHLHQIGYRNGYVTIDSDDWYIDWLFVKEAEAGRAFNRQRLCRFYSRMVNDQANFFDNMSVKALGRSVKHVLLLHETDLNAYCIYDVVRSLKKNGWKIISPEDAYLDPIASIEPSNHVRLNGGRVHALAQQGGYPGPFFSKWIEEKAMKKAFDRAKIWTSY